MLVGIIAAVVLCAAVIWGISTSNRFEVMLVSINEASSGIDVALTRRCDILQKMLDATKGYARYEAQVMTQVVGLRSGMSMMERNIANRSMDEIMGKINVLIENYPDLKASESFMRLKSAIGEAELDLQAARRAYNMNVSRYNQAIVIFPNSIIAGNTHTAKEFFVAEEAKREDVKMDFDNSYISPP